MGEPVRLLGGLAAPLPAFRPVPAPQNATHALWEWHKNQVDDSQVSDSVMLTRGSDSEACTKARAAAGAAGTSS